MGVAPRTRRSQKEEVEPAKASAATGDPADHDTAPAHKPDKAPVTTPRKPAPSEQQDAAGAADSVAATPAATSQRAGSPERPEPVPTPSLEDKKAASQAQQAASDSSSAEKPRRRIVAQLLVPPANSSSSGSAGNGGSDGDGAAPVIANKAQPATAAAAATKSTSGSQGERQRQRRPTARGGFRAVPALRAEAASEQERLRRLEQERVIDATLELARLRISYVADVDPFAGIEIDLKPKTLACLKTLAGDGSVPTAAGVGGPSQHPFKPPVPYPAKMRDLLQGDFQAAQLSKHRLLGRPSLLVRASQALKERTACGWLAGRLTEAPATSEAFTRHQLLISKRTINDLALECGEQEKYKGPDLMLDMTQHANRFRFMADTVLRPGEGNVDLAPHLLRDAEQGLVLPLFVVFTTCAVSKGEELVLKSLRDDGVEEAEQQLEEARGEGVPRAIKEAEAALEAALERRAEQEELLRSAMMEQLLASGWRQHMLDVMFQRHAALAETIASADKGGGKQLREARAAAIKRYYGGSGGGGSDGSDSEKGSSDAADLQAKLEASLRQHPPPASTKRLAAWQALKLPSEQYQVFECIEPPLQQRSSFKLRPDTCKQLDGLDGAPELPKGCRARLDSGGAFPGVAVCQVVSRLHRVRLMTPPCYRALSLNAPAKGQQLKQGECAAVYVGKVYEKGNLRNADSAYVYSISAGEISEACGGAPYAGPDLEVDALGHWNEAAFANCVFGSDKESNLKSQVIWDPVAKRPHMALLYGGAEPSQPGEELLLDYTFGTYWLAEAANARAAHEDYAALAGEVILALRAALRKAGATDEQLEDCLRPVDLAGKHQKYERADE